MKFESSYLLVLEYYFLAYFLYSSEKGWKMLTALSQSPIG